MIFLFSVQNFRMIGEKLCQKLNILKSVNVCTHALTCGMPTPELPPLSYTW